MCDWDSTILNAKTEAAEKIMQSVLHIQDAQSTFFNNMFTSFQKVTYHNLQFQQHVCQELTNLKISSAVSEFVNSAKLENITTLLKNLQSDIQKLKRDDDKRGEKEETQSETKGASDKPQS